ncbi:MAG: hypothetical protein V4649_14295 [Bacteroidota bacterium]
MKTLLYDVQFITWLKKDDSLSFIVLSGRTCSDCDENLAIYVATITASCSIPKIQKYTYPGTEYNYEDNSISFDSRMFYSRYNGRQQSKLIWLQKEYKDGKIISDIAFIVDVINDSLRETKTALQDKLPNYTELPGIDVTTEP